MPDMDANVKAELKTAQFARARFIVTVVISGVSRLGLLVRESATVHNCTLIGALHVMNVGEESVSEVSAEIMDALFIGASGSKLRSSGW